MRVPFIELPAFARHRGKYLDDEGLRRLQREMMATPLAGDVMEGRGGLRKLRFPDVRRGKGKRGGLRVTYFWWIAGAQFWMFTLYDKGEVAELDPDERRLLGQMLKRELDARR